MTTIKPTTKPTTRLQALIYRTDRGLAVLHAPSAAHARIMEAAGAEVAFVGTSGVVGAYTGMADVGIATMTECITIAGWIARSVSFPIIMDGDTGFGGIMAVRRLIGDCIHAGIAGIRIDDQPIEGKRKTQDAGLEVVPIEQAIARYRAAVDRRNELDADFVIMAQCYARDAANGGLEASLQRLKAYKEEAGVDWVQLEAPHSLDEIRQVRAAVAGPLSFMRGHLPRDLSLQALLDLGVNIAWYPGFTHDVMNAALWDFIQAFRDQNVGAWEAFVASRQDRPYPRAVDLIQGENAARQRELETRYLPPEQLEKYRLSPGHPSPHPE